MNISTIKQALSFRYGVKQFDTTKRLSEELLESILESGRMSPSAYGVEPWHFIVVENKELRKKIQEAGYGQSKITDASHLIVIASRTDAKNVADELIARTAQAQGKTVEELSGFSQMVHGAIDAKGDKAHLWLESQTYIALGFMLETSALLGVDTGPMEGFNAEAIDEILNLKEKNLHTVTMLALGYRGEDPYALLPKVRQSKEEVLTTLK